MNTLGTPEAVKAFNPDHVVVAVGANRDAPSIKGKDNKNVFDGEERAHDDRGRDVQRDPGGQGHRGDLYGLCDGHQD